jgi:predicted site-specific integrase-resolvase
MTIVSITEAANLVGLSRRTLQRHLSQGVISKCDTATGEQGIDTAELLRYYGAFVVSPDVTHVTRDMSQLVIGHDAVSHTSIDTETAVKMAELRKENELLKVLLDEKEKHNEDLRKTVLLLEDTLTKPKPEPIHQSWLGRLFGKK